MSIYHIIGDKLGHYMPFPEIYMKYCTRRPFHRLMVKCHIVRGCIDARCNGGKGLGGGGGVGVRAELDPKSTLENALISPMGLAAKIWLPRNLIRWGSVMGNKALKGLKGGISLP